MSADEVFAPLRIVYRATNDFRFPDMKIDDGEEIVITAPRVPAKSGFDLLTCGNAARHAGDGGLLGGHGPGVDHEGS